MISTVTTTTTTTTTASSTSLAGSLGLLATIALIVMLIAKELSGAEDMQAGGAGSATLSRAIDRVLNAGIVPLLIVFGMIVISRIIAVLH